jgi:hypothetical protein
MAGRGAIAGYVAVALVLLARTGYAQSGIAGVVRDTTGAVLPGVTVEAASPALIEKARTVVTNADGQYAIVDVRPGIYSVTFTLSGFSVVRRDGIELPAGFTATVNAELRVGAVSETVTVSGQAPTVDTRNVARADVLSKPMLESLPNADRLLTYAALTPGAYVPPASMDVGGAGGDPNSEFSIHGGRSLDARRLLDGMPWNSMEATGGASGHLPETQGIEEIVLVLGGGSAEYEMGGVNINVIPKTGSNSFHGGFFGNYSGHALQSNNLTAGLRAQGLSSVNSVKKLYDDDGSFGGPLRKDKLWFFIADRYWGSYTYIANSYFAKYHTDPQAWVYTPDLSRPAINGLYHNQAIARFTWNATSKQKFNFGFEPSRDCFCNIAISATTKPEASWEWQYAPNNITHSTWSYAATNKLLIEAGALFLNYHFDTELGRAFDGGPGQSNTDVISVFDASNGFRYHGALPSSGFWGNHTTNQSTQRFSVSYVTGAHTFKTGLFLQEGWRQNPQKVAQSVDYTFLAGQPLSLTEYASPLVEKERLKADLGLFVQDQWTIKRLTLNYGLRFDYFNAFIPPQSEAAGRFVPARNFAAVPCVPCWKDLDPRVGANYDVFGDGKTAIKGYLGRYGIGGAVGQGAITSNANPVLTSVNSATRTWTDNNHDYVPDCDFSNPAANGECGKISNLNFGQANPNATRYASDVLTGWGVRPYNWQSNVSVDRELWPRGRVSVGYYRIWYGNFTVTHNLATTPVDFSPYCIAAPVDLRLPGGGGNQICGLYDVSPIKFGSFANLVTQASHFGNQSEVSQYIDATVSARFRRGQVNGGISTGTTHTNSCFVVNSAQDLSYNTFNPAISNVLAPCNIVQPWGAQTQLKFSGFYGLPWDFQVSGTFQNLAGPAISATYVAANVEIKPSLGRDLSAGSAGTVSLPLIAQNTVFGPRINELDLRLTKNFVIRAKRFGLSFDLYNALNASPITGYTTQYGRSGTGWLKPTGILNGRVAKFVWQASF